MKLRFALILFALFAQTAAAQDLDDIARVEVIPGWRANADTHVAGLRITLAPGWKTYWRTPGDAGIPPQFTFGGSDNLENAQFLWPVPVVFHENGMRSIGYKDGVVIPVSITPSLPNMPIAFSGDMVIGVCDDVCVPVQLQFDAVLPADGTRDGAIVASLIDRPASADEAGVTQSTCRVEPIENGLQLTATLNVPNLSGSEEIIIETGDPMVWVSEPDVQIGDGFITATSDLIHNTGGAFGLVRSGVRVTILGETRAIDVQGCTAG
jgi:DsbC/DsbD-like thiol-disulfide interchange protein